MRILTLQHYDGDDSGLFGQIVQEHGHELATARPYLDQPLPDPCSAVAILILGGPMGVNDIHRFPWLDREVAFLSEAVRGGVGCFGVCLGAQLLAAALGSNVHRGEAPEITCNQLTLTSAAATDPIFRDLPNPMSTFSWHQDTFELPQGAVLLASSRAYPNQAFRWGDRTYGVQFHAEISLAMAQRWMQQSGADHFGVGPPEETKQDLLNEIADNLESINRAGRTIFESWLYLIEATHPDRLGITATDLSATGSG